jgi:hypothetical protein
MRDSFFVMVLSIATARIGLALHAILFARIFDAQFCVAP